MRVHERKDQSVIDFRIRVNFFNDISGGLVHEVMLVFVNLV